MNPQRILAVAHKEAREVVRDRIFFAMSFILPVVMLLVLGYGLSFDVENIPFAVLDQDRTPLSRDLIHRFSDSRYFHSLGRLRSEREIEPLLAAGWVRMVLVVPPHFAEHLEAGRSASVQTIIDGVFPYRAQTTKGYVAAIIGEVNRERLIRYLQRHEGLSAERAAALVAPVRLAPRYLYNQAVRSRWSLGSGLIMLVLMVTPPFLTALGVVREKESGSIYNIYASTVTRGEFILGKLIPYGVISSFNVGVLWVLVLWLFGAPFKGDPGFFFLASVVYVVCTSGVGLLVSILVRTQAAAALLTLVISFIPAILYSGLLVPLGSLSHEGLIEAHMFPPLYYLRILWGSFLKGLGPAALWTDLAILVAYTLVLWTLGWYGFRKRPRR